MLAYFHGLETAVDSDLRMLSVVKYGLILLGSAHWMGCIW
jgi:hypothetical protein